MEEYKMSSLIKKANAVNVLDNKFKTFNLTDNPFPSSPYISQGVLDKRYNGEIYEESIRSEEYRLISNNFLNKPQSDLNHIRIGYIIDKSYVGRGNGKSAFVLNLLKKINKEYCLDLSGEQNKCFGVYVSPEMSGRTRTFIQLLDLLVKSLFSSNIIEYSLAAIRLEAILNNKLTELTEDELSTEDDLIYNLNHDKWFKDRNIYMKDINDYFKSDTSFISINPENPIRKVRTFMDKTNAPFDTKKELLEYYSHLKKDIDKIDFVFNDLVYFFLTAGFNGAYIIIDDFERIPDFQSVRQQRDFALELRTNFFDGSSINARIGFFNLIMMLHAGVPRLIQDAWALSGMEQRSPISAITASSNHIIQFDKLTHENVILLLKKYISEYRIENDSSIMPFTEDAVRIIGEKCEYNAAKILRLSYNLIEYAVNEKCPDINKEVVEKLLQITPIETEQKVSIMEAQSEDLMSKAKSDE